MTMVHFISFISRYKVHGICHWGTLPKRLWVQQCCSTGEWRRENYYLSPPPVLAVQIFVLCRSIVQSRGSSPRIFIPLLTFFLFSQASPSLSEVEMACGGRLHALGATGTGSAPDDASSSLFPGSSSSRLQTQSTERNFMRSPTSQLGFSSSVSM